MGRLSLALCTGDLLIPKPVSGLGESGVCWIDDDSGCKMFRRSSGEVLTVEASGLLSRCK